MNLGYVYVTRFHITLKNFPADSTNSFTVIAFKSFSKIVKIHMSLKKTINSFEMKIVDYALKDGPRRFFIERDVCRTGPETSSANRAR